MKTLSIVAAVLASQLAAVTAFADPPKPRAKIAAVKKPEPAPKKTEEAPADEEPKPSTVTLICTTSAPMGSAHVMVATAVSPAPTPAPAGAPAPAPSPTPTPAPTSAVEADKTPEKPQNGVEGTKIDVMIGEAAKGIGPGAGIRFGHTSTKGFAFGMSAMYHKPDGDGAHFIYTASELGYELKVGDVKAMAYAGGGAALVIVSKGGDTATAFTPVIYPGVTLRYAVAGSFEVGADARLLYLTDADQTALAFHATAGFRF